VLLGRTIALLFYESSTRTRTSFELAAKSLGATTTLVSDKSSSIEKGESLKDTGLTLRALGAEAIVLRHPSSGAASLLARVTGLPVLNAGDGMHQHPSQALLDLKTICCGWGGTRTTVHAKTLTGVTVVITGDILHSRVARSNAMLLPRLGARVVLCGPEACCRRVRWAWVRALRAPAASRLSATSMRAAAGDVVMMLRIQKERLAGFDLDLEEFIARYQLSEARMAADCLAKVTGDASGADHSRAGDHGRSGGWAAVGDRGAGEPGARGAPRAAGAGAWGDGMRHFVRFWTSCCSSRWSARNSCSDHRSFLWVWV
jgi:aspartate carbamoyltransferase catalytic subunit